MSDSRDLIEKLVPNALALVDAVLLIGEFKHRGLFGSHDDTRTEVDHLAAVSRHCKKWLIDEQRDEETGMSHLAHAAARLLLALEMELNEEDSTDI